MQSIIIRIASTLSPSHNDHVVLIDFWRQIVLYSSENNCLGKTYFHGSKFVAACVRTYIHFGLELVFSAFRHCLQILGLGMHSVAWNHRFPITTICWMIQTIHFCGVKLLQYRYVEAWIIAKRWKQSTVGWYLEAYREPRTYNGPNLLTLFL